MLHLVIWIFTLHNYFIVLFKIAFILIQPLAARTTINVFVYLCCGYCHCLLSLNLKQTTPLIIIIIIKHI